MKAIRSRIFPFFAILLSLLSTGGEAAELLPSAPVELREVDLTYSAEAVVEAIRQSTLAAQVSGRVIEARLDAGAHFKAGETLMRIDSREAAQGLAGAQAQLANARAQLERSKNLFARKFVSQAALDKAEADYKTALASAGQAGVASGYGNIAAPFSGIVAQRFVEPGEMATPGKALLSIYDPQGLRAVVNLPQARQGEVRQALRARIEFPETGKWLDGVRVEMLPTADSLTHSVRVRVTLPGEAGLSGGVIPGMFVRAHFVIGKVKKLLVPASAILRRGELTGAYVIDENVDKGQPHLRQVRIGETVADGAVEVLAGLAAGEKVALDPVKAGFAAQR
jgi:RND family efflux transporter MFP subunit